MTAILTAFAILVQVLAPTVATARTVDSRAPAIEICSAGQAKTVTSGHAEHHKGSFGLKCADCVLASLAGATSLAPPVPVRLAQSIRVRPTLQRTGSIGPRSPPRIREQSPRAPPSL